MPRPYPDRHSSIISGGAQTQDVESGWQEGTDPRGRGRIGRLWRRSSRDDMVACDAIRSIRGAITEWKKLSHQRRQRELYQSPGAVSVSFIRRGRALGLQRKAPARDSEGLSDRTASPLRRAGQGSGNSLGSQLDLYRGGYRGGRRAGSRQAHSARRLPDLDLRFPRLLECTTSSYAP